MVVIVIIILTLQMSNYKEFFKFPCPSSQLTIKCSRISVWAFSLHSPTSYFDRLSYLDRPANNLLRERFLDKYVGKINIMRHYK